MKLSTTPLKQKYTLSFSEFLATYNSIKIQNKLASRLVSLHLNMHERKTWDVSTNIFSAHEPLHRGL